VQLLPAFADRINQLAESPEPQRWRVPPAADYFAGRLTRVETAADAQRIADLAGRLDLSHVGWDFEYGFDAPGVPVGRGEVSRDCRTIRPLLLALTLAGHEPGAGGGKLYPFVVDVRRADVLPALAAVLRMPVPYAGHYLKGDYHCLSRLGLPEPAAAWDTWACSRCLDLGRHHRKYKAAPAADPAAAARAREAAAAAAEACHALAAVCSRHGVPHPFAADKDRLQRSFLDHPAAAPFGDEQLRYAAADAIAAAELYPRQVAVAAAAGLLDHLVAIEMPWAAVNARIGWHGVRLDPDKCAAVRAACDRHLERLGPRLAELGVPNVRSHAQLKAFFERAGLLELFRDGRGHSFDKEALEAAADRHPAVPLIRAATKALQLKSDPTLSAALVGADGRAHPDHRQLGTDTGRQTCRWPNVLGLGKVLRPLVVPDPGHGVGEADLCQIEVGIAAGVYGDDALVKMVNSGDVYSAMAQHFYRDQLPDAVRGRPSQEFKTLKEYAGMRARMKRCTLGILYGLTPHGLALYLDIGRAEAAALLERFLGMFPALRQALRDTVHFGALRGYVPTATGLRRYRARGRRGRPSAWERNWMTNHPVQGTAAALFKAAGVRLDRLYRRFGARLIVPLHDAFVFEAPLEHLQSVGELTARVLCEAVQERFPDLEPRADVNVRCPGCWNKDGHADSVERWIADPTFSLG
jgi:DNA polymerase-1